MPYLLPRPGDPRWRVDHPNIRAIPLDDELVVFNPVTWETHLLNPAGALVFEALQERPLSARELQFELEACRAEADAPVRGEHIETLLAELQDLGLVTPVGTDTSDADQ